MKAYVIAPTYVLLTNVIKVVSRQVKRDRHICYVIMI